jgi:hypothetical protein
VFPVWIALLVICPSLPTHPVPKENVAMAMVCKLRTALVLLSLVVLARPVAAADDPAAKIIELYTNNKLFDKNQYPAVRAAFSAFFEARNEQRIRKALDGDYEPLLQWLDARPKLKQNLFTAIDERYDRIEAAMQIFRDLWKQFPKQLDKHPELGIAVAVTWDNPAALYNYAPHQERTKSKMPQELLDGIGNFKYLVDNEVALEGRFRNLPWEFLTFVVDHKTPLVERAWAQQYYLKNRNSKSWHQDVPYDHEMLKAEKAENGKGEAPAGRGPKLEGLDYSLENIRRYGGVCAMQADFAARVGKSVGIPAVYCSAASARGGFSHAWWTYIQVQKATTEDIQFVLRSDGQTVGFIKDAFYVGLVRDPHTGLTILDADMYRRLTLAGHDRGGLRHSSLLMRHYPWLAQNLKWDTKAKMAFIDKCMRVCPQSDEPWQAMAALVTSKVMDEESMKALRARVPTVLTSFKNYPDFVVGTFKVLAANFEPAEQIKLNQQAVTLCEKAGRPDLSCDVRLRISDSLVKDKKWQTAAEGLITTIYRFPTEGRYIPKLTQKLQDIAPNYKGGTERLAQVYLDIVPRLYVYYKTDNEAEYHKTMYKQAIGFFEANQMTANASTLKARTGQ